MPKRLTPDEVCDRAYTERQFQSMVQVIMRDMGWLYYHAPDNKPIHGRIQNVKAGFPDLCAVRGGRLIFAELKKELGRTSGAQDEWIDSLRTAGQEVYVWRPSDLPVLSGILGPGWRNP